MPDGGALGGLCRRPTCSSASSPAIGARSATCTTVGRARRFPWPAGYVGTTGWPRRSYRRCSSRSGAARTVRPGTGHVQQLALAAHPPQGGRRRAAGGRPTSPDGCPRPRAARSGRAGCRPGRARRRRRGPGSGRARPPARRTAGSADTRLLPRLHPAGGDEDDGRAPRHRQVPDVHGRATATQRARPLLGDGGAP